MITRRLTYKMHVLILSALTIAAVAMRIALSDRDTNALRAFARSASREGANAKAAKWLAFEYSAVEGGGFDATFLSKIDWGALDLTDDQRQKLKARLIESLAYLKKPTVDTYLHLKTSNVRYGFKPGKAAAACLESGHSRFAGTPEAITQTIWEIQQVKEDYGIRAICLSQIASTISRKNGVGDILSGPVRKGFTWAREATNPGFVYDLRNQSQEHGVEKPLYFHLSFFCRAGRSERAGPVYLSFAWLPQDGNWVPSLLIADSAVDLRALF